MKKLITILLIIVMAVGMIVPAYAENIQSRAVIGADLTDDQLIDAELAEDALGAA